MISQLRELTNVAQVADGQEPDADELDAVLLDNNKSIEDLKQDVELLIRRRELRRVYDQLPALSKERSSIEKQIEDADQVLKVAEDKHEALVEPLLSRLQQADAVEVAVVLWQLDEVRERPGWRTRPLGVQLSNTPNLSS